MVFGFSLSANASVDPSKLTPSEKQQIAWAIQILGEHKAIIQGQIGIKFDCKTVQMLRAEGLISDETVSMCCRNDDPLDPHPGN